MGGQVLDATGRDAVRGQALEVVMHGSGSVSVSAPMRPPELAIGLTTSSWPWKSLRPRIWMSVVLSGLASTAGIRHGEEHRHGNADGGNALEITETSSRGGLSLAGGNVDLRRAGNVVPDASAMHRPRSDRLNTMRPRRARFPVRVVVTRVCAFAA